MSPWESLPLLLALISAGVGGNFLYFPIFLNIDFLFGSIFSLLALQLFGFKRGILAAAVISTYTIVLWNHPYACLILTAEVAFVGWLLPRRRIGLVLADTLFWLAIGMPLVYLFYHGVMAVPIENTGMVMIKQAINGISNALIARLLFALYTLHSRTKLLPFREIVSTLFGLFVLGPALIILALDSRSDYARIDTQIQQSLLHDREIIRDRLEIWMNNRKAPIIALASLAATLSPPQMQARLEQAHASDSNFLRIALLDAEATTIAIVPVIDDSGGSNLGRNYRDRPFISLLKRDRQPIFSEVVIARIGVPQPVVHMLAPVVKEGKYDGYVLGALNLTTIERFLTNYAAEEGRSFVLLDRKNIIIATNDPEQRVMDPLRMRAGESHPLATGLIQSIPTLPGRTPIMERWKKSAYIDETSFDDLSGWTLRLEQPVAPFQKALYDTYTRKLTLLFLILLGALLLAELLSRLITRNHEELQKITADLPSKVADNQPIAWPGSAVLETEQLIANFRAMVDSLSAQFKTLHRINASLEERVKSHSLELLESRERHDLALLGSQDGIWEWNLLTGEVFFSNRWFEMLGYGASELASTYRLFEDLVHPDDLERVRAELRRHMQERTPYNVVVRMRRQDGSYSWILTRGQALWDETGQAVRLAGSHTDISDQKRLEEDLRANQTRLNLAHRVAHLGNWEWHPGSNELYWSEENYRIFGMDPLLPPSFDAFIATVVPEEREEVYRSVSAAHAAGSSYDLDFTILRPDNGERCVVNARADVLQNEDGEVVQLIGTVQDITLRKELEKALRDSNLLLEKTFASLNEAIFIVSTGSRLILDCNSTVEKMFGYPREELLNRSTACLHLSEEMSRTFGEAMLQAYAEKGFFETTFRMKRKDGSIFASEHSVTPIHDQQGLLVSHVCVVRDISERKRDEELILSSLREKEVLLKEIHHRVKNNLQIIHSLLTLQANSISDLSVRALFDESRDRIGTMALIHEKLYNSKDLANINFNHYLQELAANIANTYQRPEITLTMAVEPIFLDINTGIPCGLIVNELVSNSFKYAFPAGRSGGITVGLRALGEEYELTVADNGIGFPPNLDFQQTTTLGMQLVTVLSEQLQGRIDLTSAPGTLFTIRFSNKSR